jgi:uncharacterized RDD family membrane protein YckC
VSDNLRLFARRVVAYVIDCLIVFSVFVLTQISIFKPLREALHIDAQWFKNGLHTELYTLATISLPTWLYFSFFESSALMGSLGKLWLKLKVTKANARLHFWTALSRTILKLLPWESAHIANNLPTPLWYAANPGFRVGFVLSSLLFTAYVVSILLNDKGQSLYDKLLGTRVARRRGD